MMKNTTKPEYISALENEKNREYYAEKKDKNVFLSLYKKSIPKISNLNTKKRWEKMLPKERSEISPMTADRILQTSKILRAYINKHEKKNVSIFDLGIGNAFIEKSMQVKSKKNIEVVGLDIAENNLKKIEKTLQNFKGIKANFDEFLKINFERKFDTVLALEVMEHIDPEKTFKTYKKINSIIKKNGAFIVSVPIFENLKEKIEGNINFSAHVRRYTPEIIRFELEIAGFKIYKEKFLFAFSKHYWIKTILARLFKLRNPNLMIILCIKQ